MDKEIYKIWAPLGAKWTEWVRPVPFINMKNISKDYFYEEIKEHKITYIDKLDRNMAIIVDLPANESIKEGLSLARLGYRPIPIYNGTEKNKSSDCTTDNNIIKYGLLKGSEILKNMKLEKDAPPVFLLDSNRMHRYKTSISVFDNSWDIYHQDLPTYKYFLENGIDKILIVNLKRVEKDLVKILYKFQKNGIKIYYTNKYEEIKKVSLKKPLIDKN